MTKKKEAEKFLQPTSSPYLTTRENWLFPHTRIFLTCVFKISISQSKPELGTVTSHVWTRALQKSYWSSSKLGNTNRRLPTNTTKSKLVKSETISLRVSKIRSFNRKKRFPNYSGWHSDSELGYILANWTNGNFEKGKFAYHHKWVPVTTGPCHQGSLSPRHGVHSGCSWRNGLQYGEQLRIY
jgi:hypothetical protein